MKSIIYFALASLLFQSPVFAQEKKPLTMEEVITGSPNVMKMAEDINGITVKCAPKTKAKDQAYLNFSFRLDKISETQVKVSITSADGKNSIGYGGDSIIELNSSENFSQLMNGDDGRRVITFTTPGKNFEFWGSYVKGVCENVSVVSYWDGFSPGDVAECCAQGLK